jgi:hypothetical protein
LKQQYGQLKDQDKNRLRYLAKKNMADVTENQHAQTKLKKDTDSKNI